MSYLQIRESKTQAELDEDAMQLISDAGVCLLLNEANKDTIISQVTKWMFTYKVAACIAQFREGTNFINTYSLITIKIQTITCVKPVSCSLLHRRFIVAWRDL